MSHPRRIVVDDTDPAIHYEGPWVAKSESNQTLNEFGPAFGGTLRLAENNSSLSFSFVGR